MTGMQAYPVRMAPMRAKLQMGDVMHSSERGEGVRPKGMKATVSGRAVWVLSVLAHFSSH